MEEPQVVPGKYEALQEQPAYCGAELVGFFVVFVGRVGTSCSDNPWTGDPRVRNHNIDLCPYDTPPNVAFHTLNKVECFWLA